MDAIELRKKDTTALVEELRELIREQFNLRMQKATQGKEVKSHYYKQVRRNIARVKTIISEKTGEKK